MPANFSRADGLTPIVTFISMIVLGVIISEFVISEQRYKAFIIIFSFFVGIIVAALELRSNIGRRRMEAAVRTPKVSTKESKKKLARYVAELFDEDIPFDELEQNEVSDTEDQN